MKIKKNPIETNQKLSHPGPFIRESTIIPKHLNRVSAFLCGSLHDKSCAILHIKQINYVDNRQHAC